MSYFDVPADLLEDAEELSRWARKSVAVALAAASKKVKLPKAKKVAAKKAKPKKTTKQKSHRVISKHR
jgi:TfoX/Sxy family transcriptional regulator of competence genes